MDVFSFTLRAALLPAKSSPVITAHDAVCTTQSERYEEGEKLLFLLEIEPDSEFFFSARSLIAILTQISRIIFIIFTFVALVRDSDRNRNPSNITRVR
jgi:hypothetical protein